MQCGGGAFSDPNVELFRFNDPLPLSRGPELQLIGAQLEMNCLLCAWGKVHPLETFQLPHGARGAAGTLVNVELDHGIAQAAAGVGYIHGRVQSRAHFRLGLAELQVVESKRCIAQAESEGVEGGAQNIPVARGEIGGVFGTLGEVVVVVERELPGTARPAYGQVTGRIGIAEQDVRYAVAALTSRIPGF